MYRSSIQTIGGSEDAPDYVYYNADIINNTTGDRAGGRVVIDPQVRFNETRDTAVIKNAADYYFSIIRFTMDGANKDLPLFIPNIEEGTGQVNVNLTTYSMAFSYQQTWNTSLGAQTFTIVPPPRFIQYVPETQNPESAPPPSPMSADKFRGLYNPATTYQIGDIVSTTGPDPLYNTFQGPFFQVGTPQAWSVSRQYQNGNFVGYGTQAFVAIGVPPLGVPPIVGPNWALGLTGIAPAVPSFYWNTIAGDQGTSQDLSTRYYWVYTYQHWIDIVNRTIYDPAQAASTAGPPNVPVAPATASTCCLQDTYFAFANEWANRGLVAPANPFPFPTLQDFINFVNAPKMLYDQASNLFSLYCDSDGYGERLTTFTPQAYVAGPPGVAGQQTSPVFRPFFNANMYGLFSNFNNTYWNTQLPALSPFGGATIAPATAGNLTPIGYTNEILITNKFYQNVVDYRVAPYSGVPPLGFVPALQQKPYWVITQDYQSNDTLWSPISSIVFTSTLLPVKTEATGAPVVLGNGNLGFSAPTIQSAFQPIITDIALDTSSGGASDYRKFIYYAPSAEYRLTDFASSKQDIRNIDIQVYWKNRLDNNLYPINMFNLSSVSIKVMFKHKNAVSKGERTTSGF